MQKFILFFRGGEFKPEDQKLSALWPDWFSQLKKSGNLLEWAALTENGKRVFESGRTEEFAFSLTDNASGFAIMVAENLDRAVELTKDCPIFRTQGNITIRPMTET